MTAPNDRFWAKVFFRDFIKHYRKMTPEQIVDDVEKSMDDLENLEDSGTSFGAKMIRASIGRAENYPQASENGKKGGRPRKSPMPDENPETPSTEESSAHRPEPERRQAATQQQPRQQAQPVDPKAESGTPAKFSTAYAGKNGLVRLTDDEYAMLLQELGNKRKADKLIDDLDYAIAEGKTFRQPHLHVLTHWQSYREDKAAEAAEMAKVNADARAEAFAKRGYKTAEERQQEELAKINDFCTGLRNGTIKIEKEG